LLFLFGIGHSLEQYAMGRARRPSRRWPSSRRIRPPCGATATPKVSRLRELQLGDVVIVRPNERLPADGVVVVGTTSVNQAPVTGESVPVDKRPTDDAKAALAAFDGSRPEFRVFAGTINGAGAIEVMVARGRSVDDGAGRQDGDRGAGAALADAAVHRTLRAHLRAVGAGAGGRAAVRVAS
jgi:Cd2+/Zn2+-exporting ATPase